MENMSFFCYVFVAPPLNLEPCCPLALGLFIDLFLVLVYFFFVFINDLSKIITLNNLKILSRLIQLLVVFGHWRKFIDIGYHSGFVLVLFFSSIKYYHSL